MILYTCGQKKRAALLGHPCGRAAKALDSAGYTYELRVVGNYRLLPWMRSNRDEERAEIRRLSGTNEVPIMILDDGEVISGSVTIARWAHAHPLAKAAAKSGA